MPETINNLFKTPEDIILFVLALAVLLVFIGCIYAFFRAIFLFIFSKGEDSKVKAAMNSIRYMIIGLFLTVMLLFVGPQVLKLFKLSNSEVYTARNVFTKIGDIVTGVGSLVSMAVRDYPASLWNGTSNSSTNRPTTYEL